VSKIKVLVIDDSAMIRKLLTELINNQPDMEVVATAPDPLIARELIKLHNPDVLTLDIEMPKMDGLAFLERLMRLRPMPVVMVSTLTERGSEHTLRALELGAVDFVAKPKLSMIHSIMEYADQIADKIRSASKAKVRTQTLPVAPAAPGLNRITNLRNRQLSHEKLIFIGASTGGTVAIKELIINMPTDCPGILITQHMPVGFTKSFADRLDSLCQIHVKEAQDGEQIFPGHAYVAPGGMHLCLSRVGAHYVTQVLDSPPVNRHKPAVDVMFNSAASCVGKNAIGVILTGMGKDGALGMLEMKKAGAYNFAQDQESCVVYGMPKEAVAAGGVDESHPLQNLASRILNHLSSSPK
jgi:two-component system chemotaxis response regulator CheB